MAYRRTHCYAMHQHLPYVPTPKMFWFSTSFNATKKIFLTRVSPHGGKHLLSIYLGILVYLPCSKAQNTRKKWVVPSTGSCDLCLSEGTKLKQSHQSPIVRAPVM